MAKIKRGLRYHNAEDDVIKFSYIEGDSEIIANALIVNESHSGIACVYVGNPLNQGSSITWLESKEIKTACEVIRCEELKDNVFFLAFEYEKK